MLDLARVRADTPSASQQAFLLSAGASLMPAPVVAAMHSYLALEASVGGYGAAEREAVRLQAVYDSVAGLINAHPHEIALTGSATAAWQMAFYSLDFKPGDIILTSDAEYGANYVAFLQMRKRVGIEIRIVPGTVSGEVDLAALESMISPRVKLISLTWIPTNGGLVNPAAGVGKVARAHRIPYLLDACQAVGQLPVDVGELGCDMLSAAGRKFLRGPRGTGFLYVRNNFLETLEPHVIDHFSAPWVSRDAYQLRTDARRFETWENNYAARLGLGAAADYALEIGLDAIAGRCGMLARRLRGGLSSLPGIQLRDLGRDQSAIVSFTVDSTPAEEVVAAAARAGIAISTSSPETTRLDAERRHLPPVIRASPHYFNTEADIDRLLAFVDQS